MASPIRCSVPLGGRSTPSGRGTVIRLPIVIVLAGLFVFAGTYPLSAQRARDVTFEERVACQEAIERVYYSHQIRATKPFEEAVPRNVLENKVRTYLRQSMALEELWDCDDPDCTGVPPCPLLKSSGDDKIDLPS